MFSRINLGNVACMVVAIVVGITASSPSYAQHFELKYKRATFSPTHQYASVLIYPTSNVEVPFAMSAVLANGGFAGMGPGSSGTLRANKKLQLLYGPVQAGAMADADVFKGKIGAGPAGSIQEKTFTIDAPEETVVSITGASVSKPRNDPDYLSYTYQDINYVSYKVEATPLATTGLNLKLIAYRTNGDGDPVKLGLGTKIDSFTLPLNADWRTAESRKFYYTMPRGERLHSIRLKLVYSSTGVIFPGGLSSEFKFEDKMQQGGAAAPAGNGQSGGGGNGSGS